MRRTVGNQSRPMELVSRDWFGETPLTSHGVLELTFQTIQRIQDDICWYHLDEVTKRRPARCETSVLRQLVYRCAAPANRKVIALSPARLDARANIDRHCQHCRALPHVLERIRHDIPNNKIVVLRVLVTQQFWRKARDVAMAVDVQHSERFNLGVLYCLAVWTKNSRDHSVNLTNEMDLGGLARQIPESIQKISKAISGIAAGKQTRNVSSF